jgi:hypothetical protein
VARDPNADENFRLARQQLQEQWRNQQAQRDADWAARSPHAAPDDSRAKAEQRVRGRKDPRTRYTGGKAARPSKSKPKVKAKPKAQPKAGKKFIFCLLWVAAGMGYTLLNAALLVNLLQGSPF